MSRALVMSDYADPDTEIERLEAKVASQSKAIEAARSSLPNETWWTQPLPPEADIPLVRSLVGVWRRLAEALAALEGKP